MAAASALRRPVVRLVLEAGVAAAGPGGGARADAGLSARPRVGPAGTITTIAGGVGGPGRATTVGIDEPCGLAFAGQVYIASPTVIRQVDPATDHLTTPVGVGIGGAAPTGTPARMAELVTDYFGACGVAADSRRDLAVTAPRGNQIRFAPTSSGTFFGHVMTADDIYTVAGDGTAGFTGDGGPAIAAELAGPTAC